MFKGFQNTSKSNGFNGFPALNFQMNNEAYGFSGCTLWLDAAYGTNTQTDLAPVSLWQSRIGNITFVQTTAGNQPRYSSSIINLVPAIDFTVSGTRTMVTISNQSIGISNTNCTFFIVYKAASFTIGLNSVLTNGNSFVNSIALGGSNAGVPGFGYYTNEFSSQISASNENTNAQIVILKFGISGNAEIFVNGISSATGSTTSPNSFNQIGSISFNANSRALIGELGFFNRSLSSSECIQLSDRLNSKYAIY